MCDVEGDRVRLRAAAADDVEALAAIRATPEVRRWWRGGPDFRADVVAGLADVDVHVLTICLAHGQVVGSVQWSEEEDPDYRHATVDIFLDPAVHGQGYGAEAVRLLVRHLFDERGHHRLTIDPAADNAAAIRCYRAVGFRTVGVLRRYERGDDDTWHDGVLMELLRDDLDGAQVNDQPSIEC